MNFSYKAHLHTQFYSVYSDSEDDVIIVENFRDVATATTDQSSHTTEFSNSSSQSIPIPSVSHYPYPESSHHSDTDESCPGPSSISHCRESSRDSFRPRSQTRFSLASAHHNVTATTGQCNALGTAPEAKVAEYDSVAIESDASLDYLLTLFQATLSKKQVSAIFDLACNDFDQTMECLLSGPDLSNILKLMSEASRNSPVIKVHIDEDEAWSDIVSFYKTSDADISRCRIRVCLNSQPAIDTGGVRCQVYTSILKQFAENQHFKLFDGPPDSLWPYYSAATRCSGMFKVLGSIVGHSILQDEIGFPHLSAACYWYIAAGEEAALQHLTLDDVGADCCYFISPVSATVYMHVLIDIHGYIATGIYVNI